jgi:hypothetical protein
VAKGSSVARAPRGRNEDPSVVAARAARLATGVVAPFARISKWMSNGFALAAVVAFGIGITARSPIAGALTGIVLSAVAALVAWRPFRDPKMRAAAELYYDHDCHERWEWKAEHGKPPPRNRAGYEAWLDSNPAGHDAASILLTFGRLAEADSAIAATAARTPEEAYSLEVLRQERVLLAGGKPDLAPLHAEWRSLPDPRERRHRRQCLALLEAKLAVANGGDPIAVLAVARQESGDVHRSMRLPWILARWSGLAVALTGTAVVLSIVVIAGS